MTIVPAYETARSRTPELMDARDADPEELVGVYRELAWINRWLGGHATTLAGLNRARGLEAARTFTFLDVGCGGGELAPRVLEWADRRGLSARYIGIDDDDAAIGFARAHHASQRSSFEHANLFQLAPRSYDVVHMALTLHHFDGDEAVQALKAMRRAARSAVIINDLHRHRIPFEASKWLTWLRRSPRYVRFDAPVSVNRAFKRDDLQALARRAGFTQYELTWIPMFRWLLVGR